MHDNEYKLKKFINDNEILIPSAVYFSTHKTVYCIISKLSK